MGMKIAVILYGQPRFIDRPDALRNLKDTILDKYEADIFAQMWYDSNGNYGNLPSWVTEKNGGRLNSPVPHRAFDIVHEHYNPVKLLIEKPIHPVFKESVEKYITEKFRDNYFFSMNNMRNIVSQCQAIENACRIVPHDYHWYVIARYDAIITGFPELKYLNRNRFYLPEGGDFNDLIHVFSDPIYLEYAYGLAKSLTADTSYHIQTKIPIPELYKFHAFKRRYGSLAALEKIPMYAEVIRT